MADLEGMSTVLWIVSGSVTSWTKNADGAEVVALALMLIVSTACTVSTIPLSEPWLCVLLIASHPWYWKQSVTSWKVAEPLQLLVNSSIATVPSPCRHYSALWLHNAPKQWNTHMLHSSTARKYWKKERRRGWSHKLVKLRGILK